MIIYLSIILIWFVIDFIISKVSKSLTIYGEYISFIHSFTAIMITYNQFTKIDEGDYIIPRNNSEMQNYTAFFSLLYFILDLLKVCIKKKLYMFIGHHIFSISIISFILLTNEYANILINVIFLAELSIPFYVIYKYLNKYKNNFRKLILWVYLTYSCTFAITRVYFLGNLLLNYIMYSSNNIFIISLPSLFIYFGSLLWVQHLYFNLRNNKIYIIN
jgi:hypothetical protein